MLRPFRVYPEPDKRTLFVRVRVHSSHAAMRANAKVRGHYLALFQSLEQRYCDSRRMTGLVGDVHFVRNQMSAGVIAHEFLHAALEWAERVRLDLKEDPRRRHRAAGLLVDAEERLCYAQQAMIEQFYERAQRLQLFVRRNDTSVEGTR